MRPATLGTIAIGVLLLVFLLLLVRRYEGRLVFFPSFHWDARLQDYRPVEELWIRSSDGVDLSAVWLENENPRAVVVYCHGNAGNLSHRLPTADRWRREFQVSVLLFDYRGYGRSEGNPSEDGIVQDTRAAVARARRLAAGKPIVLYGRSLGTVPAIRLAADESVGGLMLDSPLTNAREMASQLIPIPGIGRLTSFQLDNLRFIRQVSCPLLLIHGSEDRIIPLAQARRVFEAAPEPKNFLLLEGEGHNEERSGADFSEAFREFLRIVQR